MSDRSLSIIRGKPLAEEPGLGALTMGGWLTEVAAEFASREALVFHDGDQVIRWTYDDLLREANDVARALIALEVDHGTRVGVLMTNRPEFLSSVFGVALAGGVATTISTFSTPDELEHLLAASACAVLLVESQVLKRNFVDTLIALEPALATKNNDRLCSEKFPFLRHIAAVGECQGRIESWQDFLHRGAIIDAAQITARAASINPADPGALFFSSGTTSKPKGIVSSHRGVSLQLWRWRRFYKTDRDARTWSANGFFWSGNFGMAIGGSLSAGGCLVLQPYFDPEEALSLMETEKASMAIAWPHQWAQLAAASNWSGVDLSALKYVNPSSPLGQHPTVSTDWQEPVAAYGNTETFTISSIFESGTPEEDIAGSHGEPQPGMVFKIVDPLTGVVVPVGTEGEIAVKGPTLMLGYLGIPADETFDEDGYFCTGDGGYVDERGRLFWKGRLNDIIKTGGANVSPVEVDSILRTCPGIKIVQTVGVPHETLGEIVIACVVLHDDSSLDETAVKSFAKERLASYKVPRRVLMLAESDLKTTGTAKVKTEDLRTLVAARLEEDPSD